ncbi:hypothetical protein F5883DRAFT_585887 [Diaporthe sp. PMI_573]|nr:hypothetical protein F5883DRAFT_586169 [Diaporthaceae sp. PMI_573]KAH8746086.1 hypothetical protein F5883DRAFT_585887 [Diaporthaceae sp. PMI_573]
MAFPERVLLTGGNGLVGSAVLVALCEAGYNVVAVIRRQEAVDKISPHPAIKRFSHQVQWKIIPDVTKSDAFLEAVKSCHYIVHVASPAPPVPPRPMDLRTPAVQGTQAILNAAESEPLVKRVVITASVVSLLKLEHLNPDHPIYQPGGKVPVMSGETHYPTPTERPDDATSAPFHRYCDSKLASRNLTLDYAAAHPDSHFKIVLLCPGYILGPGILVTNKAEALASSNIMLALAIMDLRKAINPVFGLSAEQPTPCLSEFVWIDDVVLGHTRALTVPLPLDTNVKTWVMAVDPPNGPQLTDVEKILKQKSPELAKSVSFDGEVRPLAANVDSAATQEELLGRPYTQFEDQVVRALEWLFSLPDAQPQTA